MTVPKVSVLLSSFNHEHYLREAIDSILNQTFTDFELIIIDDASSDGSWGVIESYSDPRIHAIRHERQLGPVLGARQAITELARGEYIAINHSDDAWEPEKLAMQCTLLDADPALGAVFTWVQIIDEHGRRLANDWFCRNNQTRWEWLRELFDEKNHLAHPSLLIRKECYVRVGMYHPGLMQTPDVDMWCRLLINWPIHVVPERLTLHRIFTNQTNTSSSARPEVRIRAANEWNYLRRHFLRLGEVSDVFRIFPELAEKFRPSEGGNIQFLLAMACLYCCQSPGAWLLGIEWLFDLMDDDVTRLQLASKYGFTYDELMVLSGRYDVYGYVERTRLQGECQVQREGFEKSQAEVARFWSELQASQKEVARLWGEFQGSREEAVGLWRDLEVSREEVSRLRGELDGLRQGAARFQEEGAQLRQRLERITRSKGYRVLKKLKVIRNV
ncbi:MAG: glycosyltransferase [Zoogloea oleivorans]|jgi:glycosyltransferase involved in cell wall biosynthesis|uniref:glycosyltransferase n=1 Tax=Zoogloea oleivorans TaxID=1552750 RepID=UPI002A35DEFB|nr:glycosyltransferase [Zoogloea oleivorans]MDY0036823.1 glycosyltransferase [Zoogloea oleivorans]